MASTNDVLAMREKWADAGLITRDEMQTSCCYALQDKTWVRDPDGNEWEVFVVLEDNLAETAPCECGTKVVESTTLRKLRLHAARPRRSELRVNHPLPKRLVAEGNWHCNVAGCGRWLRNHGRTTGGRQCCDRASGKLDSHWRRARCPDFDIWSNIGRAFQSSGYSG